MFAAKPRETRPIDQIILDDIKNPLSKAIMKARLSIDIFYKDNHKRLTHLTSVASFSKTMSDYITKIINQAIQEIDILLKHNNTSINQKEERNSLLPIDYAAICFMPTIMQFLIQKGAQFRTAEDHSPSALCYLHELKIHQFNHQKELGDPLSFQEPNPFETCSAIMRQHVRDTLWQKSDQMAELRLLPEWNKYGSFKQDEQRSASQK